MNFPLSTHDVYKPLLMLRHRYVRILQQCMQISTTGIMCVWMDECSWWAASWRVVTATSVCMCVNGWIALHNNAWETNHMLSLQDSKASFSSGFINPVWKCHLAVCLHAFISFCSTVWLGPFASICLLGCLLAFIHIGDGGNSALKLIQSITDIDWGTDWGVHDLLLFVCWLSLKIIA